MTGNPSLLNGLDADALFACAQDFAPQPRLMHSWEPPSLEELAGQFPDWKVVRLTGRGGMAAVYEMHQPELGRNVAVRVLPAELGADAAVAERFRGGEFVRRADHPGRVSVFEACPDHHRIACHGHGVPELVRCLANADRGRLQIRLLGPCAAAVFCESPDHHGVA